MPGMLAPSLATVSRMLAVTLRYARIRSHVLHSAAGRILALHAPRFLVIGMTMDRDHSLARTDTTSVRGDPGETMCPAINSGYARSSAFRTPASTSTRSSGTDADRCISP